MGISSMQIINFIKTQSAFVGLLPSHTWRCVGLGGGREGSRKQSSTLGDTNLGENVRGEVDERGSSVCVRDKQMDGWMDG